MHLKKEVVDKRNIKSEFHKLDMVEMHMLQTDRDGEIKPAMEIRFRSYVDEEAFTKGMAGSGAGVTMRMDIPEALQKLLCDYICSMAKITRTSNQPETVKSEDGLKDIPVKPQFHDAVTG